MNMILYYAYRFKQILPYKMQNRIFNKIKEEGATEDFKQQYWEECADFKAGFAWYSNRINIISLGWDCFPRTICTWWGLKKTKKEGELSCPFDLSMHNIKYINEILQNKFQDYFDTLSYNNENGYWYNSKYNITYNHDQNCVNLELFKERYINRIKNFYSLINEDKYTFFIYHALPDDKPEQIVTLYNLLSEFKLNNFHLIILCEEKINIPFHKNISICFNKIPYADFVWWSEDKNILKVCYEKKVVSQCAKIIKKCITQN